MEHIVIGIGGSATNDGGAGMVQALGARLLDAQNNDIAHGGAGLEALAVIDISQLDARLAACRIEVACDVTNRLTGKEGASAVFGPQRGHARSGCPFGSSVNPLCSADLTRPDVNVLNWLAAVPLGHGRGAVCILRRAVA